MNSCRYIIVDIDDPEYVWTGQAFSQAKELAKSYSYEDLPDQLSDFLWLDVHTAPSDTDPLDAAYYDDDGNDAEKVTLVLKV